MLGNNFSTSTCCAIFELIKLMCFGSTLSNPHKEFLNPCPARTKHNPLPPRPAASSTRTRRARIAVRVSAPAPQCRYPQPARVNPLRAGLYCSKHTLNY